MTDNRPISERYHEAAVQWCDEEAAATILSETKSAIFSEMISNLISSNLNIALNRAEVIVKSSPDWRSYVTRMVDQRKKANLCKVQMEYLRMLHSENQSREATARMEMRV